MKTKGIHHITAITRDAQKNIDFYTGPLGLRFVKQSVNNDDPTAYHLYYGNASGEPGTALTFFVWPGVPQGEVGAPQIATLSFSIPHGSTRFWVERLTKNEIVYEQSAHPVIEKERITFEDPDGLAVEFVEDADIAHFEPWVSDGISREHAIRGFHSVTLHESDIENTTAFLSTAMDYKLLKEKDGMFWYSTEESVPGRYIVVRHVPNDPRGQIGAGSIHHVAFRTQDKKEQSRWHDFLSSTGINVTQSIDRYYFRSIYFHEPGGILFEIATDIPGFTIDEPLEKLGSQLKLPPWYEESRGAIESILPHIQIPNTVPYEK